VANEYDTKDLATFLSDFAVEVTATTWGTTFNAIFDEDFVEFEDVSRVAPFVLCETADVDAAAASGDLFTINGTDYKLVDVQHADPGVSRLLMALA
jgi:hypothetical protein